VAVALLGGSTYLSFRYWKTETLTAARSQVLLAGGSTRSALEAELAVGARSRARELLARTVEETPISTARVFDRDGNILLSADPADEGGRLVGVWIPHASELPAEGLVRTNGGTQAVTAFLPMETPQPAILQLEFSVSGMLSAMDRGARLGMGLVIASALVLTIVVLALLEREVVAPIRDVEGMLRRMDPDDPDQPRDRGRSEVDRLQAGVAALVASEEAALRKVEESESELLAQEGLVQAGELATEMAHEFKRPLASIRTAVGLLEQEYVLEGSGQQVLGAVKGQLTHLAETMQDLFSLARPLESGQEAVPMSELLDDAVIELAGFPGAAKVEVVRDYPRELPAVECDPRRLEQAFLNVLVNAVEAMPQGGRLTIRCRAIGDRLVLAEFMDTGPGIPPEKAEEVVRPFYSTKPQGTGLGLPLVARVVDAHRGKMRIDSSPSGGARIRICLPRSLRMPAEEVSCL
jgi:signal transduction histidine kinase